MEKTSSRSDVVIIGGVAAGPKTAAVLARRDGRLAITLFQKEKILSYGSCGLPYFASGDIDNLKQLTSTSYGLVRSPEFFRNSKGFEAVVGAEVTKINRRDKTVTVRLADTGETFEHGYGRLVIATGARPKKSPFPVADLPSIRPFTRPDDAVAFRKMAETGQIRKAIIIGGGFIGCEMAEAAGGLWGIETVLIEKESHLLPSVLDAEMVAIVQRGMTGRGIEIITDATVENIIADDGRPVVSLTGRESITTDYVFLCLGVEPETGLAAECGLAIGVTGGISVNDRLQTSDPDIFAGGDCVESRHQLTGQPCYLPMGSLANRHGAVIAENIAGGGATFPGVLGAFLVKIFDLNVGAIGLSQYSAEQAAIPADAVWGTFPDRPEYYPGGNTLTAKLVYHPRTGQILGLQAVGRGDICRRIDSLSALLSRRATLDDLINFEHGYAPPYAEPLDPLHHLAAMARAKIKGINFEPPDYDPGSSAFWLDLREPAEVAAEPWPMRADRYLNIPLDDLRNRLSELDPAGQIVIICKRGPRAYQAAVILRQAGFDHISIIGGGYEAAIK